MTDTNANFLSKELIDIANQEQSSIKRSINKVGMSGIECPIQLDVDGQHMTIPATCDATVDLHNVDAKGIHMSRLYTVLQQSLSKQVLSVSVLDSILKDFVSSHDNLSTNAYLSLHFESILKQSALKSDHSAYRYYPVSIHASLKEKRVQLSLEFSISYSSTCPCSAALARQAIQEKFSHDFLGKETVSKSDMEAWLLKEENILATPHAQRSHATFRLDFNSVQDLAIKQWINEAEYVIQTAVQSLVKRVDEQEFAIKNGQNLMFCEDAIRRFDAWLDKKDSLRDYHVKVDHHESLHPHNATAETSKSTQ